MFQRLLLCGFFLIVAAALPYLSSEWVQDSSPRTSSQAAALVNRAATDAATSALTQSGNMAAPALGLSQLNSPQPDQPPLVDLAEAIRFNVTVPWLFSRWPRVTSGLPEGDLQGYRVPLVTGTREDDLAGSLTYYFDAQQVCQKITFQGALGDPRKLVAHVVSQFGLKRQASDDPGMHLYQTKWNGKPVSQLRIKVAPVVKSSMPHERYDVEMTLVRWRK
jgi:hypothetical protein